MIINPIFVSATDDNDSNVFSEIIKKASLTKAMWNIAVIDIILLSFIFLYMKVPALNNSNFLTGQDIRMAFWLVVSLSIFFMVLFGLAEVIKSIVFNEKND